MDFFKRAGASNQFETLGFIRSIKYSISWYPISFSSSCYSLWWKAPSEGHGFQLHVGPMRSESRGYVEYNLLILKEHLRLNSITWAMKMISIFRKALKLSREILSDALKPFKGPEIQPEMKLSQRRPRWIYKIIVSLLTILVVHVK